MNKNLKDYLIIITDENIDNKEEMIMNLGLLLEKNNNNNPTDYSLLLPSELVDITLTQEDKNIIISCLHNLLIKEPKYSSSIIWSIGKTFDEKIIEELLFTIIQTKHCNEKSFTQISFLVDVVSNEKIKQLFHEIELLKG